MTTDQYLTDLERRLKKLEGNDAFRDSETRAIRKLAESAERQVRYLQEPYYALNSYLDRFHAPKEVKKIVWQSGKDWWLLGKFIGGALFVTAVITIFAMWGIK